MTYIHCSRHCPVLLLDSTTIIPSVAKLYLEEFAQTLVTMLLTIIQKFVET